MLKLTLFLTTLSFEVYDVNIATSSCQLKRSCAKLYDVTF